MCAEVLYDYMARREEEISLKVGDIVTNITQEDQSWWEGDTNGKHGMFPGNYVALVKPGDAKMQMKFDHTPDSSNSIFGSPVNRMDPINSSLFTRLSVLNALFSELVHLFLVARLKIGDLCF